MKEHRRWILCAGATSLLAAAASAQTPAPATGEEAKLDEITVTANRIEESAQKAAVSVQVYSAEDLINHGVNNLQALAAADPSITFAFSTGEPYIAMRGVSTGNVTETGNPSVAVATDGIFLNRSYSLNATMYDLQRVEVIRGPQGTLYGRNAVGGVLNIITARPTNQLEGSAAVEAGNFDTMNLEGMLNFPLSDTLAVRFAAASFYHDGYRDNSPSPDRGDDQNSRSARAQVLFQPSDQFSAWLSFGYTRIDAAGAAALPLRFDGPNNVPTHNPQPIGDGDAFPIYAPHFEQSQTKDLKWNFAYSGLPGDTTVMLLGGWNSIDWHHASPSLSNPTFGWVPGGTTSNTAYFQNEFPKTMSHELRLASPTAQRLSWQTGLYYFQEKSNLASRFIDNFGTAFQNDNITTFNFPRVDSDSKAAYGQTSFAVTDAFKLTAGVRYTKDSIIRRGTFDLYRTITPGPGQIHVTPNVNGQASSSKVTWMGVADWDLSPVNLLYGKVSMGYKAGGFTGAGSYLPESLLAYEIGSKNRFANDRVQFNAAAYWMDYTDQQLNQFSDPVAGAQTVNADSRIYGLEAGLIALVEPVGKFELNANYLHARITAFTPPANFNPLVSASVIGNKVPLSPTLALSAQFEHDWSDVLGGRITGRLQGKYESGKYFSANNFASTFQKGNTVANASIDYQKADSNWTVQLYGRNLTDETVLIDAEEVYVGPNYLYNFAPPRTFGIRISANFQ